MVHDKDSECERVRERERDRDRERENKVEMGTYSWFMIRIQNANQEEYLQRKTER